jgi:DNA-binding LacI/PurR family transcriptional regulator
MAATITEAAQAAGVTRQTVSELCNHHEAFQAEQSERRASALKDAQQQRDDRRAQGVMYSPSM